MENTLKLKNFSGKGVCAKNFILLAYSDCCKYRTNDLLGCTGDKRSIVFYREKKHPSRYELFLCKEVEKNKAENAEICTIIPADYDSSGNTSYLIVSRMESGCYANLIYFYYRDTYGRLDVEMSKDSVKPIGETTSVPFLFSLRSMESALLMQNNSRTFICKYAVGGSGNVEISTSNVALEKLHRLHTSGFVDVTGNASPNLVLEFEDGNARFLKIYNLGIDNCFECIETLHLPREIGPIALADFNKSCYVDIAYVSKESTGFYLNIVFNHGGRANCGKIYDNLQESKSSFERYLLNGIIKNYEPVLVDGEIGMPSGLFVVDLFCDSVQHIILTMKHEKLDEFHLILMKNNGKGQFSAVCDMFGEVPRHRVISISFSDIMFAGRENLLVNFRDETPGKECILGLYKNNLSENNFYFSSLTCSGASRCNEKEESFGPPLPGASCRYKILENDSVIVGHQMSQSTFPHLQHQYAFFGLGTSPSCLIELEVLGPPSFEHRIEKMRQKVIPNSKVVFYKDRNGNTCIALNLNPDIQIRNILTVIVLFSSLLILILLFFFVRRIKRESIRRKAEEISFDFGAL